jgi:Ribbon-helix-helix protein, copG family
MDRPGNALPPQEHLLGEKNFSPLLGRQGEQQPTPKGGDIVKTVYLSRYPALNVRVKPETLERITAIAEVRGTTVSAIVREVLDRTFTPRSATVGG